MQVTRIAMSIHIMKYLSEWKISLHAQLGTKHAKMAIKLDIYGYQTSLKTPAYRIQSFVNGES